MYCILNRSDLFVVNRKPRKDKSVVVQWLSVAVFSSGDFFFSHPIRVRAKPKNRNFNLCFPTSIESSALYNFFFTEFFSISSTECQNIARTYHRNAVRYLVISVDIDVVRNTQRTYTSIISQQTRYFRFEHISINDKTGFLI